MSKVANKRHAIDRIDPGEEYSTNWVVLSEKLPSLDGREADVSKFLLDLLHCTDFQQQNKPY